MSAALAAQSGRTAIGADGITRVIRRERSPQAPWVEHYCVVAPTAEVADKARPGFDGMVAAVAQGDLVLI